MKKQMLKFDTPDRFTLFLVVLFGTALFMVKDYSWGGQVFPGLVTITGVILSLWMLFADMRKRAKAATDNISTQGTAEAAATDTVTGIKALRYLIWFLALYAATALFGFKIAITLWFVFFLRMEAHARWFTIILCTAISMYLTFVHMENLLSVHWPDNLLSRWIDIKWLF